MPTCRRSSAPCLGRCHECRSTQFRPVCSSEYLRQQYAPKLVLLFKNRPLLPVLDRVNNGPFVERAIKGGRIIVASVVKKSKSLIFRPGQISGYGGIGGLRRPTSGCPFSVKTRASAAPSGRDRPSGGSVTVFLVIVGAARELGGAAPVADPFLLGLLERVVIALTALRAGEAPNHPLDQLGVVVDFTFQTLSRAMPCLPSRVSSSSACGNGARKPVENEPLAVRLVDAVGDHADNESSETSLPASITSLACLPPDFVPALPRRAQHVTGRKLNDARIGSRGVL